MTRNEFINRLKQGLTGLPAATIADVVADYEAHFTDGVAAGRSEAEVAAALGDPARLARELRAEIGLKQWEDTKSPSSAISAVFAVLGLGAIDILILLPLLMGVIGTLFGFFMSAIGIFIASGVVFATGAFWMPGGVFAALLGGVGGMALAVTIAGLTAIVSVWLVNGLVWYARLHYRLLKPALDAQNA